MQFSESYLSHSCAKKCHQSYGDKIGSWDFLFLHREESTITYLLIREVQSVISYETEVIPYWETPLHWEQEIENLTVQIL